MECKHNIMFINTERNVFDSIFRMERKRCDMLQSVHRTSAMARCKDCLQQVSVFLCVCVCVCVFARACARACMCACAGLILGSWPSGPMTHLKIVESGHFG